MGYVEVTSYVAETADGQRVTCFVSHSSYARGISCVPHLK